MKTLLLAFTLLAASWTASAQSTVEAMPDYLPTNPSGGSPVFSAIFSSINGPIGWTFQPLVDINVTALGAFQYIIPGSGNLNIGLWNSSGSLLASQTVNSASSPVGHSRYSSIAPLLLAAGQTYFLAAYSSAGVLQAVVVTPGMEPNGSASMSPEIALGLVAYSSNSGFTFPATTDGLPGYAIIAPNFEYQVVPEPSTLALLGGGTITLVCWRRKGRTASVA